MSKFIDRLAKKIKEDLGIEVDPNTFISIRPKPCYKLMGTWSWEMSVIGSEFLKVGSIYTATECVRKNVKLYRVDQHPGCWHNDIEVVPDESKEESRITLNRCEEGGLS